MLSEFYVSFMSNAVSQLATSRVMNGRDIDPLLLTTGNVVGYGKNCVKWCGPIIARHLLCNILNVSCHILRNPMIIRNEYICIYICIYIVFTPNLTI